MLQTPNKDLNLRQSAYIPKPRTKRLIVRGAERRCGQTAFNGPDRRRNTYDRRKLAQPRHTKPPMSEAGRVGGGGSAHGAYEATPRPRHVPGYVASVAADLGAQRRASGLEASTRYGAAAAQRTASLLRGLSLDSEIS
ncbi:MAG: hypothetical protein AAGH82_00175 [Pseudomonadota bacterium]